MEFQIKTRFNIGDKIWVFTRGIDLIPQQVMITRVLIGYDIQLGIGNNNAPTIEETTIVYSFWVPGETNSYGHIKTKPGDEHKIATTREELMTQINKTAG